MPRRRLVVAQPSPLPPLYARWIDDLVRGPIPAESEATCDDCAMCPRAGEDAGATSFDPQTKCCTYLPILPNFLVGEILEDRDPEARQGRASVERRMKERVSVSPLGLGTPAPYALLYGHAIDQDGFGRTPSLRCLHLSDDGRCGIWKHRASVCSTWFCKHVRGGAGRNFWQNGVQQLLSSVERALARWCVLELDPGTDALLRLFPRSKGDTPGGVGDDAQTHYDPVAYRATWGTWLGRERELYVESARRVAKLGWKDVVRIGGVEVATRARLARDLYARMTEDAVPELLMAGAIGITPIGYDTVRVTTYSTYDPLDLPAAVVLLLGRFNGKRSTAAVLADIRRDDGVELDPALVRRLVDFEILVSPSDR